MADAAGTILLAEEPNIQNVVGNIWPCICNGPKYTGNSSPDLYQVDPSPDAKNFGNVLPPNAECGLEKHPSIGVKALKKTAIEHDASWIALSRLDGHLPAENERGQNDASFASVMKYSSW